MSSYLLTGRVIRPSPTATCRIGNEPVRSLRNNVAHEQQCSEEGTRERTSTIQSILNVGSKDGVLRKTQVNCRENRRQIRTALLCETGCAKKACRRNDRSVISHSITTFLPADRQFLRHSHTALTWNLVSPYFRCICSRLTVRKAVGSAGKGSLKKQMPACNGTDRGKVENVVTANKTDALTRKGADFRQVWKRNADKQLTSGGQ